MNENHPIFTALLLLKEGDKEFDQRNFEKALKSFFEAITMANMIPENEWDKQTFLATCNSRLSGAYGKLGKVEESLKYANKALDRLDTVGHLYPVEFGWWWAAKFNKGAALAGLARFDEALKMINEAKKMLNNSAEHSNYRNQCDKVIQMIKENKDTSQGKWWKFW